MLKVKGFLLVNDEKIERALNGSPMQDGTRKGGVIKEDGSYDDDALLAEYDKMGGLIKKGNDKLKIGCFYNFKLRKPKVEPEIVFVFRVNGQTVEVPAGVELPGEVKAVKILEEQSEIAPRAKRGKRTK